MYVMTIQNIRTHELGYFTFSYDEMLVAIRNIMEAGYSIIISIVKV